MSAGRGQGAWQVARRGRGARAAPAATSWWGRNVILRLFRCAPATRCRYCGIPGSRLRFLTG